MSTTPNRLPGTRGAEVAVAVPMQDEVRGGRSPNTIPWRPPWGRPGIWPARTYQTQNIPHHVHIKQIIDTKPFTF